MIEGIRYIDDDTLGVFVPMEVKRRGGRAVVILPKNNNDFVNYDNKLISAFGKAYKWKKMLEDKNLTISMLAEKEGVSDKYLSRVLRLNLVAPDIIESIMSGTQPPSLRLTDFMTKPIPDLWDEQREVYGLS